MSGPWLCQKGHRCHWASQGPQCGVFFPFPSRTLPKTCMEKIVENVRKFNIQGLLVIGGFEVWRNPECRSALWCQRWHLPHLTGPSWPLVVG